MLISFVFFLFFCFFVFLFFVFVLVVEILVSASFGIRKSTEQPLNGENS